jgi:hypothetical protein
MEVLDCLIARAIFIFPRNTCELVHGLKDMVRKNMARRQEESLLLLRDQSAGRLCGLRALFVPAAVAGGGLLVVYGWWTGYPGPTSNLTYDSQSKPILLHPLPGGPSTSI